MLPHQGSRLGNEHLGSGAGSKSSSPWVQSTRLHGVGGAASSKEPPLQIMMQGARLTCQQAKLTDQPSADREGETSCRVTKGFQAEGPRKAILEVPPARPTA